eukprot:TRINITY_DN3803_c0_g1_i8.p2 TRINITY_DN3803_c0_g1~~TRINITY_DN3803_c0_g1_i8.p2  ORF type:complete len:113 (-),score=41.88 TRINITY_DN3803_c0_g1_i8:57-395(-)
MIRRPPRSTLSSSSAASDVYKRQAPKEAAPKKEAPKKEAPKEAEFNLEEQRAAARAKAKEFAASLTPEEAAIYGAKIQVAASGVRLDSDSDSDGGADFAVGGEDDGMMLGDY